MAMMGRNEMHAIIRSYSGPGAKELVDLLEQRRQEVESIIGGVTGFVSYAVMRTGDGGATITVCEDKAGTDESLQKARDWVQKNAPHLNLSPPTVLEGPVAFKLG